MGAYLAISLTMHIICTHVVWSNVYYANHSRRTSYASGNGCSVIGAIIGISSFGLNAKIIYFNAAVFIVRIFWFCLLYTSPSPRDRG